jgi:hypothetical protein
VDEAVQLLPGFPDTAIANIFLTALVNEYKKQKEARERVRRK